MINNKIDPKIKKFLIPRLRKAWLMWPERQACIKAARVERGSYKCAICKQEGFKRNDLHVDHISPAQNVETGLDTWYDLIIWITKLYVYIPDLQACCEQCHSSKTFIENKMRQFYRTQKKK